MESSLLCSTVFGDMLLTAGENALTGLYLPGGFPETIPPERHSSILISASRELQEYCSGKRKTFDIPLEPHGTPFQLRVWAELCTIPYGNCISYGELAVRIGKPGAPRAVGQANHRNPIAIMIPCHRVIAAHGHLGGYGGGLDLKIDLLRLEGFLL